MRFEENGFVFITIVWQWCVISGSADYKRENCPSLVKKSPHYVATSNQTCYLFVDIEKTWEDARDFCFRMGGELVIINDRATMNFVSKVLDSSELGWTNNGVWNGANKIRKKRWEWTTGEPLTYRYWAEGEPSRTLFLLSFENCCCMRRYENWRWHDYSCDVFTYTYNFICQFPFMHHKNEPSETSYHESERVPVTRDETVAIVGLSVGGVVLMVCLLIALYILRRKRKQQKARMEEMHIRFQNQDYVTPNMPEPNVVRPTSHIYFDPVEVNQIYEDINKDTDYGVNTLLNQTHEAAPMNYTGGASLAAAASVSAADGSAMDGYVTPSEASGATSGYCSNTSTTERKEPDYVEMTGSGAKATNIYVTAKKMNEPLPPKPNNTEIHIYTNQLEGEEEQLLTPSSPLLKQNGSLAFKEGNGELN